MAFLKDSWGELLRNNIANYAVGRPKRAMFIESYLNSKNIIHEDFLCLEQGAFSAKDSLYLKKRYPNWHCTATDKDEDVVNHIIDKGLEGYKQDAFNLTFEDECFDLSFQSGLIVLFSNRQAEKIIAEQLRVTSKISFVFAHNKKNYLDRAISFIKRKLLRKSIFTFRRFSESELKVISERLGYKYEILYHDNMIINFANRHVAFIVPFLKTLGIHRIDSFANELVVVFHK